MDPYTPAEGDAAIQLLREIFGSAVSAVIGGGGAASNATANMLSTAFGVLNSGVLFFGAIILMWVTIFGIANTANDGQVLGKKWSTFYTPLRTITASAMLIPSASGYSAIQLAILLVVSWSCGLASTMWGAAVGYYFNDGARQEAIRVAAEDSSFDDLAFSALRMRVCAYGLAKGVGMTTGQQLNLVPTYENTTDSSAKINPYQSSTYTTTISLRDQSWPGSEDICGRVSIRNTYVKPDTNSAASGQVANSIRAAIQNIQYAYVLSLFTTGQASVGSFSVKLPESKIEQLERTIVEVAENPDADATISANAIHSAVASIRAQMQTDIAAEIQNQLAKSNNELSEKFKSRGWIYAGSLHRELAHIKDAVRGTTKTAATFTPGSGSTKQLMPGAVGNSVDHVMDQYNALTAQIDQKRSNTTGQSATGQPVLPSLESSWSISDFADGGNSLKSKLTGYFNSISERILRGMIFYLAEEGGDPVMQVKNIGDYAVVFAEAVLLTKAGVSATLDSLHDASMQTVAGFNVSALSAATRFVLRFCEELWNIAAPGIYTILYAGFFLGYWVPMLPYVIFSLGVVGWVIQVGESLAAGALWMVMHLTPERDDSFIGSQQQGYLLLMSLFCRPALMVLGLVFSVAALGPIVRFINAGFMLSVEVLQSDSVTGVLSIAAYTLIYAFVIYNVFMLIFSLPQTLPDRILRWVGAGIGDLGEQGSIQRIEGGASGQARAAALAGASRMARNDQENKRKRDEVRRAASPEQDGVRPAETGIEGHAK